MGGGGSDKFRIIKIVFKNSSTKTLTSARYFYRCWAFKKWEWWCFSQCFKENSKSGYYFYYWGFKKWGAMIFFSMCLKRGNKIWGAKVPLETMTRTLVVLKLQNFPSWHLNWWICFCKLKRRIFGAFTLIFRIEYLT